MFKSLFLILSLVLLLACNQTLNEGLAPGQLAPDFQLKNLAGQTVSLSDFRGKNVLLNFWASWCLPCKQEINNLEKLSKLNPEKLIVLGIAVDDQLPDVAKFITDYQVTFPIALDADSKLKNKYGVTGFPESYFIDPAGKIKLLLDPDKQSLEAKITGPREWDKPALSQQLLQ